MAPDLPRGWFELAHLSPQDRVEFVEMFWDLHLPYVPHIEEAIERFFKSLDDIGVYLTQETSDSPFEPQMVYSLREDKGFFHALPPADLTDVVDAFPVLLPADYRAFLSIHDNFSKATDTGLVPAHRLKAAYGEMQTLLGDSDPLKRPNGVVIDPKSLIPFYQSFGMQSFQCFSSDWYPEQEMGNLYYSGVDHALSDYSQRSRWAENLAFPTFLDWLVFYLESLNI